MILGSLVDAGLPLEALQDLLKPLNIEGYNLTARQVIKNGIRATKVDVNLDHDLPERKFLEIEAILRSSQLEKSIILRAVSILRRLGEVEAHIHNEPLEQVHLHELGGLDTIIDVVGALVGLSFMGVEQVYASPLSLGRGFIKSAHGVIPLPAPATMALLKDTLVVGSDLNAELVTPTGAALLTSLCKGFGQIPPMKLIAVGYGAGGRDLPIPNVIRLLVGESASPGKVEQESLVLLETNIDDMNPEIFEYVMGRLFDAGALDVYISDIQMKKNRPGTILHVLSKPEDADSLLGILFAETSTLGIRSHSVQRFALPRTSRLINTPYGPVRVKVAEWSPGKTKFAPEYEDCRKLAQQHQVPLREIYQTVESLAQDMSIDLDTSE